MVDFNRASRERESAFELYEELSFKGGWRKGNRSWSYSTYGQYEQCPRKIFFAKIVGLKDPMGPAAQRGIKVHKVAEQYVKGEVDDVKYACLRDFQVDLDQFRDSDTVQAEMDFTFTAKWKKTHWRDWDNAWVRMKIDVLDLPNQKVVYVVDYKTGHRRDYSKQQDLYGLAGFKAYPRAEKVLFDIFYLDHGKTHDAIEGVEFTKDEEAGLQKKWEDRVDPMMNDEIFRARPHWQTCGWCAFSKHRGGPCQESAGS